LVDDIIQQYIYKQTKIQIKFNFKSHVEYDRADCVLFIFEIQFDVSSMVECLPS
jgi:hypothetical protein